MEEDRCLFSLNVRRFEFMRESRAMSTRVVPKAFFDLRQERAFNSGGRFLLPEIGRPQVAPVRAGPLPARRKLELLDLRSLPVAVLKLGH